MTQITASGKQAKSSFTKKGIGIIELALFTVLVGMVATIMVSLADTTNTPSVLREAASILGQELEQARLTALTDRTGTRVVFDRAERSYQVAQHLNGKWVDRGPSQKLPDGVRLLSARTMEFDQDGLAPAFGQLMLGDTEGHVLYLNIEIHAGVSVERMPF